MKRLALGLRPRQALRDIHRAFYVIELNNMYLEKDDAKQRGKHIIREAKRIVKGARHSVISVSQSAALSKTASEMSMDDELNFTVGVWRQVIGTHRTVAYMNENDKIVLVERVWEKDNLKCNWRSPFAAHITSSLRFADPEMEAFADWIPKLKDSVPFLTYGYRESTFTPEQMNANGIVNGEICRRNWHPFLIVEAESVDLLFQQGVAQALRAAAATINLKRKLVEEAKSTVNADISTTK